MEEVNSTIIYCNIFNVTVYFQYNNNITIKIKKMTKALKICNFFPLVVLRLVDKCKTLSLNPST
jgi:hypothetical protein